MAQLLSVLIVLYINLLGKNYAIKVLKESRNKAS